MKTYSITDDKSAICDVQKMLATVYNDSYITPNGVYDEKTKNAVLFLQNESGIKETGKVDKITFDALKSIYNLTKTKRKVRAENKHIKFPILYGTTGITVLQINNMMKTILDFYGFQHNVRTGFSFNMGALLGVSLLREIYRLDCKEYVDEELYNFMLLDYGEIINLTTSV